MAQKAAKQQASRNAAVLNRLHLISLIVNGIFVLLRFLVFRGFLTRNTWLLYIALSAPAMFIELLFERNSRPVVGANGEVRRAGDDLEAKGLTEYMFDVLYWTWGCVVCAALFGNKAWWLYLVVPVYSAWLAFTTFGNVRQGLMGMGAAGQDGESSAAQGAGSKRQQKLEKRGGQRVQYR